MRAVRVVLRLIYESHAVWSEARPARGSIFVLSDDVWREACVHGGHRPEAALGETRQASSNEPAENAEWGEDSLDGSGKSALLAARNLLCSMHDIDGVVRVTSDKAD